MQNEWSGLTSTVAAPDPAEGLPSTKMPAPVRTISALESFLNEVVCDGRFVDVVTRDPRTVAQALGIELSAQTEATVKQKPLREHLAEYYSGNYAIVWGPIAIVVAVAIVLGIVVVVAWKYSSMTLTDMAPPVRDSSAHAHLKL